MAGLVAEEKLILLNNWFFLANFSEYMRTELVLAVPLPPMSSTDLLHKGFLFYLGWLRMQLIRYSALKESLVGISSCENWKFFSGGFQASGVHSFQSAHPLEGSK